MPQLENAVVMPASNPPASSTAPERTVSSRAALVTDAPSFVCREFFPRRTRYCVVVVVLNEGDRLRRQLGRMRERAELADIVVADGDSSDGSTDPAFLTAMGVRALLVTQEQGLSTATRMGLSYAMDQGYEAVITIDGNGKDGVEALPAFLEALESGYDLVQGSRFMKGGVHRNTPWERYVGIRYVMAPLLALGCRFYYSDPTNAFRALSMRFLKDPKVQPLRPVFVRFSLQHYLIYRAARLGYRITEVPVSRVYPDDGSVPTKIIGLRLKLQNLFELVKTVARCYDVEG